MKIGIGGKHRNIFILALAVLLVNSIFSFFLSYNLVNRAQWTTHTLDVKNQLHSLVSEFKDAEFESIGSFLNKDSLFALPNLAVHLQHSQDDYGRLRKLVADNPKELLNVDSLNAILLVKYQELKNTKDKERYFRSASDDTIRGRIAFYFQKIMGVEDGLFVKRLNQFHFISTLNVPVLLFTSFLAMAIILGFYFYAQSVLRDRIQQAKTLAVSELRLKEKVTSLNRSNQELEQFAYVASHDLQEPLRKIMAFIDRVKTRHVAEMSTPVQEYFSKIEHSASRMRTLINDLLRFSRLTPKELLFAQVSLKKIMDQVVLNYGELLNHTKGKIHVGQMPHISGNLQQLTLLFGNIVHNALKFSKPAYPPAIFIYARLLDGAEISEELTGKPFCQVVIQDNGIGFDNKYAEKIFTIFQRLHGKNEYEGTGIGLAICKKIVDNHEGFIFAQGIPNQGATLTVTLPTHQKGG